MLHCVLDKDTVCLWILREMLPLTGNNGRYGSTIISAAILLVGNPARFLYYGKKSFFFNMINTVDSLKIRQNKLIPFVSGRTIRKKMY